MSKAIQQEGARCEKNPLDLIPKFTCQDLAPYSPITSSITSNTPRKILPRGRPGFQGSHWPWSCSAIMPHPKYLLAGQGAGRWFPSGIYGGNSKAL